MFDTMTHHFEQLVTRKWSYEVDRQKSGMAWNRMHTVQPTCSLIDFKRKTIRRVMELKSIVFEWKSVEIALWNERFEIIEKAWIVWISLNWLKWTG